MYVCGRPFNIRVFILSCPTLQKKTGMRSEDLPMPESFKRGTSTSDLKARYCFSPVLGSRNNVPFLLIFVKLNIWLIELAIPSQDPCPMRCPPSQLPSTNRMMAVWPVTLWSPQFSFAHGAMPSSACLPQAPQLP